MSAHTITWYQDNRGVVGEVACHAPEGAACRLGCDRPCLDGPGCGHSQVDRGTCGMTPFLTEADPNLDELYAGRRVQLTGPQPIAFVPIGAEGYGWAYAPKEEGETGAPT